MGWPKKNKEKEEVTPPDNPPVAPQTRHQQLVHVMDKIWKPYKDEAEEFKVDVHYFKKFMDLVYSVYIKRGSRHQRRLLEDFFDEETAPSKDTQKADWVRTVGSMIIREPLLRDGLELSPLLILFSKRAWLTELEQKVGKGNLNTQWEILPQEFPYFRSLLRPHLDDKAMWYMRENITGQDMWEPTLGLDNHGKAIEPTGSAQTNFVIRAFTLLNNDKAFEKRVMNSLLR